MARHQYDDTHDTSGAAVWIAIAAITAILVVASCEMRPAHADDRPGMAVWLMVQKREDGVVRRYLDERRPTIAACLGEAGEVLRAAVEHPGDYELRAPCAVRQTPKDPA